MTSRKEYIYDHATKSPHPFRIQTAQSALDVLDQPHQVCNALCHFFSVQAGNAAFEIMF